MQNIAETCECLETLIAAFAAAEYVVDAGRPPLKLRLGRATPTIDQIVDGRVWAIITAHNPDGRQQSDRRNAAAHAALSECLDRITPAVRLPARNRDPNGRWPDEPGWLFTPEDIAQADRLARHFGQRAIVSGRGGQRAELRVYDAAGARLPDLARRVRS